MKRKLTVVIVLLSLISIFTIQAFATLNTYKLDELGLELSIPSTYDVITQDTPTSSSIFNNLGVSGKELIDQFKINGIYLNAIPIDSLYEEIVVTMIDNSLWDNLSALSDTTIKTLFSIMICDFETYGFVVLDYDVYHHSQAKFIKAHFTDSTNSVYGLQFYTTYGSKAMNFTIRSYSGELTQKQEEAIQSIVDSIKFDTAPISFSDVSDVIETEAFVYTDIDTNTKFTVPANWYEKELSKEREFLDVKFMSAKEDGMSIIYGSTDIWEIMTEEERKGTTRSDMHNSALSTENIAELLGADESDISRVLYNGVEYYQVITKSSTEIYGLDFSLEMTQLFRIENGWGYIFQFSGTPDNVYFDDFESLLNSVEYPGAVMLT